MLETWHSDMTLETLKGSSQSGQSEHEEFLGSYICVHAWRGAWIFWIDSCWLCVSSDNVPSSTAITCFDCNIFVVCYIVCKVSRVSKILESLLVTLCHLWSIKIHPFWLCRARAQMRQLPCRRSSQQQEQKLASLIRRQTLMDQTCSKKKNTNGSLGILGGYLRDRNAQTDH